MPRGADLLFIKYYNFRLCITRINPRIGEGKKLHYSFSNALDSKASGYEKVMRSGGLHLG